MLDVAKASKELAEKSMIEIERATALTWGGRAAASYTRCVEAGDNALGLQRFWEGETYRGEALEHAAMVEEDALVSELRREIETYRSKAKKTLTSQGR